MYQSCIFCSRGLGHNESIETFPVGQALAFDGWKGRLWCICPWCRRWNLAPLEERWEAVEEAERSFRDARRRVHSENIGLAELPDGTRLVRVGEALPGELAAWRYGRELRRRRWRYWIQAGFGMAVGVVVGAPVWPSQLTRKRVLYRVSPDRTPDGRGAIVREQDLHGAEFRSAPSTGGRPSARLTATIPARRGWLRRRPVLELDGTAARMVLERALVTVNQSGASHRQLDRALETLERAGSAEHLVAALAGGPTTVEPTRARAPYEPRRAGTGDGEPDGSVLRLRKRWHYVSWHGEWSAGPDGRRMHEPTRTIALEMALHESAERRALEGELAALEARWREAEEIARIADAL